MSNESPEFTNISPVTGFPMWWILDEDDNPVPESDLLEYSMFRLDYKNIIKKRDYINGYKIETIFNGSNTRHADDGFPLLWSTGIFNNEGILLGEYECRTKQDALDWHDKATEAAKTGNFDFEADAWTPW